MTKQNGRVEPAEHYTTGTIGFGFRDNVNGLVLTHDERNDFAADICRALVDLNAEVLFIGTGQGQWEGVTEPAGSITFRLAINYLITVRKASLRTALAATAAKYDQDAIAITFGDTVLVESDHSVTYTDV